jgi:hypothetical protein
MVKRQTTTQRRTRATMPAARPAPVIEAMQPRLGAIRARLDAAGCRVQGAGRAATRFARSSVREMTTAAKAAREPMQAVWRSVRLAGRHIARDAMTMWQEVAPARPALKLPAARRARRPAA